MNATQQHLDLAASQGGYLDAINGTTPESLVDAQQKMKPFWEAIEDSTDQNMPILSVGLGQGEENHALQSLRPDRTIIGLDLAQTTIDRTVERLRRHDIEAGLVMADAANIPLRNGSLGGVVMSAVLHEVFSYSQPNGHATLTNSIGSVATALADKGTLYIREFTCPPQQEGLQLTPITGDAKSFTEYFREHFRVGLDPNAPQEIALRQDGSESSGSIVQTLMHFRNHWNDATKGYTFVGDTSWKELRETYLIPHPEDSSEYLDAQSFCATVVEAAAHHAQQLRLDRLDIIPRKKVNLFLRNHFVITDASGNDITQPFLTAGTSKMEAVFKKTQP